MSNERFDRLVADLREDAEYIDNYSGFVGSPDRIVRTQLAAADTLIRLRAALEWYGENARLSRLIHGEGDRGRAALSEDGGSRASAAIAASQPAGGEGE